MADRADLHDLLDGPEEELDFEPDEEAAVPAASVQRQKAPHAAKPARASPQRRPPAADGSARAKDPISWRASMDGGGSGGSGGAGSGQQHDSVQGSQRGERSSGLGHGRGDEAPKKPTNSVIGFLRQRLAAAEAPPAEPSRKPALKSQLADKSKAVPAHVPQTADGEGAGNGALSMTAKRREERKHARAREPVGQSEVQEPVRKRQASPGARPGDGGHARGRSSSRGDPDERLRGPFAHEILLVDAPPYHMDRHHSRPLEPDSRQPGGLGPWLPRSAERYIGRGGSGPPPPPPHLNGPRCERDWMGPPRRGPGPWDAPPPPFDDRHYDRLAPFERPPPFDGPPFGGRPHYDRPPFERPPFERPPPPFGGFYDDRPPVGRPGRSRSPPPPLCRLSPPLRRRSPSPPVALPPPPPAPGGKSKRSLEEENDRRGYGSRAGYSPPRKRGGAPPSPPHAGLRPQHSGRPSTVARQQEAVPEHRRALSPEARRAAASAAAARVQPEAERRKLDAERDGSGRRRHDPATDRAAARSPPRKVPASSNKAGDSGKGAESAPAAPKAKPKAVAPGAARSSGAAAKDGPPAQQSAAAVPKPAAQASESGVSTAQRSGAAKPASGPQGNSSTGSKEAVKPAATAAQPAAAPARSSDQSSRFTFSTPASEEKLWYYRDTKGVVQGPHSVREYRSWLQGLERLITLKPEMARELDEFSSMLLWREGSSKRVPILKVVG